MNGETLPQFDAVTARSKTGQLWMALINIDPVNAVDIEPLAENGYVTKASGSVLTATEVNTVNDFDKPDAVLAKPVAFKRDQNGRMIITLPPKSITVVMLEN